MHPATRYWLWAWFGVKRLGLNVKRLGSCYRTSFLIQIKHNFNYHIIMHVPSATGCKLKPTNPIKVIALWITKFPDLYNDDVSIYTRMTDWNALWVMKQVKGVTAIMCKVLKASTTNSSTGLHTRTDTTFNLSDCTHHTDSESSATGMR